MVPCTCAEVRLLRHDPNLDPVPGATALLPNLIKPSDVCHSVHADGTVAVDFEDGDKEERVMSCYVSLKLGKQPQRPLPSQSQAAARLVRAPQGAGERPVAGVDGERVAAGVRGERTAADVGGATGVGIAVAGAVGQMDEDEKEGAGVEANGVESARSLAVEAANGEAEVDGVEDGVGAARETAAAEAANGEVEVDGEEAAKSEGVTRNGEAEATVVVERMQEAEAAMAGKRRVTETRRMEDLEAARKPASFVSRSAALNSELGSSASVAQQVVSPTVSQPAQHMNSRPTHHLD